MGCGDHPLVVVMGVTGAGKSTLGEALAARLDLPYVDGDDLHPPANVAKMRAGHPLDEADRRPWLAAVGDWLADHRAGGAVVACSALRRSYRDTLREHAGRICFVHLAGPESVVAERVAARAGHFMPASLVESQYALLEPLAADEDGITVPLRWPLEKILGHVLAQPAPPAAP